MQYLYEYHDTLNSPYEAFLYDTENMSFPVRQHWHYFMEMIYMLEGTGTIECDGRSYTVEEGDLILFFPEAVHAIYTEKAQRLKYNVIKFDVNRLHTENSYVPNLRIILDAANKDPRINILFKENSIRDLHLSDIFEECRRELKEQNYGYDIVVRNQISYMLVRLIRIWREQGFNTDAAMGSAADVSSIRDITLYIDTHAGESMKVEDLAEMCNMSYSYFAKNFKQYYGRSCKEYIEFIRVSKAADMLLFTDFDLSYISQETGFSDSSHLIKTFRKWKGVTPKQFKKQHAAGG